MTEITALDPRGTYVRMTVMVNPALFRFLAHKGFTVVRSVPTPNKEN